MLGLLWGRRVTAANVSEKAGFVVVFAATLAYVTCVVRFFVDRGYPVTLPAWVVSVTGGHTQLERVQPAEGQKGFAVQPKRWIVERTFAWLSWSRRLSKDYEQTTKSSEAWVDVSAIRFTLRKIKA